MASQTIHRKKNGAAYVYSVESYWDKEKKAPRNKQVCLGRLDEHTGEIIPSTRKTRAGLRAAAAPGVTANAKIYGPYLLLMKLAEDTGLFEAIKKSFPDICEELLSLVFFITQKGLALSRCAVWSESHKHPFDQPISSQRVSEILKLITEKARQRFLSLWLKRLSEIELLCYDITSISSYATANEYLYRGYNRDQEKLPQINLAMLFGQKSGLPAYFRRMPGNISDVSTLKNTIDTLDFLGKSKLHFVLDQGFYSESNVDALFGKRYRFILKIPTGRVWVRNILDQYYDKIASPQQYRKVGENEALYMISHLHQWGGRRCYVHLYYNASKAAEDFDHLTSKLVICKKELETGDRRDGHNELYERFFFIKETPKRGLSVKYNEAEIQKYRKRYAGFFGLMTNVNTDSLELLETYRGKEVVEKCFDDLKNGLDMKRLRIHSSEAMESRLFIQFLALILISAMRTKTKKSKELQYMSAREVMEALEPVVLITYSGRYGCIISETGPLQKYISNTFNFNLQT